MARPAAKYLTSALARRSEAENRLTEVLACVVSADEQLRNELLGRLGLDGWSGTNVQTQMATGVRRRTMDMHMELNSASEGPAELWFEHKVDSPWGEGQLDDYELAIGNRRTRGDDVRFVVILSSQPSADEREQLSRFGTAVLRWHDVADVIDRVLVARGRDWYRAALRPDAPSKLRVLAELAVYLQEFAEVAVIEPLDDDLVAALRNIEAARETADELLDRIADGLEPGCQEKEYDGRVAEERWLSLSSLGWWNALSGGTLYLWVASTAGFADDADPVPSFGVSVQCDKSARLRLMRDRDFLDALDDADLVLGSYPNEDLLDIGASVPLETVVGRRGLSEQATELSEFAATTIAKIAKCVPKGLQADAGPAKERLTGTLDPSGLFPSARDLTLPP